MDISGFPIAGFFLTQLAQYIVIHKPIIAIGSAGQINNRQGPHNKVHLLIGTKDQWHYEHAINLYNQSKNTNLTINLVEYDDGHEIPINTLKNIIQKVSS
jgi:predicted esterase